MADYVYPRRDLDRADVLPTYLGAFWSQVYDDQAFVRSYAYWCAQLAAQAEQNLAEAVASVGRFTLPVWHTEQQYQAVLVESSLMDDALHAPRYGENGLAYGDPRLLYGRALTRRFYRFPLPSGLREAPLIVNRLTSPSLVWCEGIDYRLDWTERLIEFRDNPFEYAFSYNNVYDADGELTDRELSLWLLRPKFDADFVYEHHGYPLRTRLESSENYKRFVNVSWDAIVLGSRRATVEEFLSAVADSPVAAGDETVLHVARDARNQLVVTDKNVYRLPFAATLVVSEGDELTAGQFLSGAVAIYELHRGAMPDELRSLTLGRGFLAFDALEGVTFQNKETALLVDETGSLTHVSFELGGWPTDVELFWQTLQERGEQTGQTLAHLLDQRPSPLGEPEARHLPETINPLEFLVTNVLRFHAAVVVLRPAQFGEKPLSLALLRDLKRHLPPHTALFVIAELAGYEDIITMESAGDENATGYEETAQPFASPPSTQETIDGTVMISEEASLRYVDGVCL